MKYDNYDRDPSDYPSFYYPELNTPYRGIALPAYIEKTKGDEKKELIEWEKFVKSLERSWSNNNERSSNNS